jgi:hypothetical protein
LIMPTVPVPTPPGPGPGSEIKLIVKFLVIASVILGILAKLSGADLTIGKMILAIMPLAGSLTLAYIMGQVSKKRKEKNGNNQREDPDSKTSDPGIG